MLILSSADVISLLDLEALVEAVRTAMIDLSEGRASMPSRVAALVSAQDALLAAMPVYLPSAGALTTKLVSLFPRNREHPTHQALVCCFDPSTGTPVAVMDGTFLTAMRTAAGSALATRLLARPQASHVAVIGTGVQAHAHARALALLPGVRTVQIAGRDPGKAEALAGELVAAGVPAQAAASSEEAVRSADIVCTTTHAERPVLRREWVRPGTHINSVGYNTSGEGELDTQTIQSALVVVESRATALAPPPVGAVELVRAIGQRAIDASHIAAELGQIAAGSAPGRTDDSQITLYKSVGVAVQDAAAAALILDIAQQRGVGTQVSL